MLCSPAWHPLQLVTPEALADMSGTATRCTALALYSKMQRPVDTSVSHLPAGSAVGCDAPLTLPVCSQPLILLADAAMHPGAPDAQNPQQEQLRQVHDSNAAVAVAEEQPARLQAGPVPRTLHCFYTLPPPGTSQLPLVFADSCGELMHVEVSDLAAARISSLNSSDHLPDAAPGNSPSSPVERACRQVLERSLQLLGMLRAASNPPNLLRCLAIGSGRMGQEERRVWRQLLEAEPSLQLELPPGVEAAVVEVEALAPARCACSTSPALQGGVKG